MEYTPISRINPYTGLVCTLCASSTEEQWEAQFQSQVVMLEQLALLEDDEEE